MPFIEIITDTKSQIELNKMISGEIVNNCDIMYIKEKNIENIKNIKLETLIINKEVKNNEIMNKIIFNAKNLIYNKDFNEKLSIGKTKEEKEEIEGRKIITIGYNSKSDITVSSVLEDEALICIQNTIVSTYGRKILPQEVKVDVKSNVNIYNIMIIIALTCLYAR